MKVDYSTLCAALRAAGFALFEREPYGAKNCAQANLRGRTVYVEDHTLRFHHSRILSARILCGGAAFLIIESVALDMRNTRRGVRFVLFDVEGEVIEAPDLDSCQQSKAKALAAFWAWFNGFDLAQHYAAKLEREAARLKRLSAERAKVSRALQRAIDKANKAKGGA